eukprot:366589_1
MTTSLTNFKCLKNVKSSIKYAVFGYVRKCESILNFPTIPLCVPFLCLWYYYLDEHWIDYGPGMQLCETNDIITMTKSEQNKAWAKLSIDASIKCIHKWDLKLLRCKGLIYIRIDSTNKCNRNDWRCTNCTILNDYFNIVCMMCDNPMTSNALKNWKCKFCEKVNDKNRIYCGTNGCHTSINRSFRQPFYAISSGAETYQISELGDIVSEQYGDYFDEGDIVSIEFNTNKKTLQVHINSVNQGIAFRNIDVLKTYYLSVIMHRKKDSIQIIDYTETHVKN